jgi:hypothetical protein
MNIYLYFHITPGIPRPCIFLAATWDNSSLAQSIEIRTVLVMILKMQSIKVGSDRTEMILTQKMGEYKYKQ